MIGLFRIQLRGETRHRSKAVADNDTHQQHETRNETGQRHNGSQCAIVGDLVAIIRGLADRDAASVGAGTNLKAPGTLATHESLQAVGNVIGQARQTCIDVRRGLPEFFDDHARFGIDAMLDHRPSL